MQDATKVKKYFKKRFLDAGVCVQQQDSERLWLFPVTLKQLFQAFCTRLLGGDALYCSEIVKINKMLWKK